MKSSYKDLHATFPELSTQKPKTWEVRVDDVPYCTAVALLAAGCLSSQALPPILALPLDLPFEAGTGQVWSGDKAGSSISICLESQSRQVNSYRLAT